MHARRLFPRRRKSAGRSRQRPGRSVGRAMGMELLEDRRLLATFSVTGLAGREGAGFDVFVEEPLAKDHPLRAFPKGGRGGPASVSPAFAEVTSRSIAMEISDAG